MKKGTSSTSKSIFVPMARARQSASRSEAAEQYNTELATRQTHRETNGTAGKMNTDEGGVEAQLGGDKPKRDPPTRRTQKAENGNGGRTRTVVGIALLAVGVGVAVGVGLASTQTRSNSNDENVGASSSLSSSSGGGMYDIYVDGNQEENVDVDENYGQRPTRLPTPKPPSQPSHQTQNIDTPTKQSQTVLDMLYGELSSGNGDDESSTSSSEKRTVLDKPNVLMIPVDDLNTWVGYTGKNKQSKTPNFDRLSAMGVSFTNAHAASTICNPSRAALWSGMRPSTSGCYDNKDEPWTRFVAEGLNMNAHFKQNGWYTAAMGKTYHSSKAGFHKAEELKTVYPSEWNEYPKTQKKTIIPPYLAGFTEDFVDADIYQDEDDADYHTAEFCIDQMGKFAERDQPTFLACGIIKPHLPWAVPQRYYDMYPLSDIDVPDAPDDDLDDVPKMGWNLARPDKEDANVTKLSRHREAVQGYLASVAFADFCLGRILDAYEAMPKAQRDNTIIVLWSDHGYHLGQKKHWKKATLWEEGSEIPYIWVVPGLTTPNTISNRPVDTMSVYPTLCRLMGLPVPDHVEGVDIRQLLADPKSDWNGKALSTMGYKNHAVVDEKWRYVLYKDGTEELYDHDNDPHEHVNLAGYGGIYNLIKTNLARYMPKTNMEKWDRDFSQTCSDRYESADTVKQCGDGTFVARNPKLNCRFTPCPE